MTGTSRMLAIVSRKPALVCSVRAVPTCVRGLYSLTSAENCAESATTLKPQTTASTSKTKEGAPNVSGESAAQIALTIIAAPATRAFPHSSAQRPANTQPIDPDAIAMNAKSEPALGDAPASDAAANAAIQVHIA